MRESGGEYGRGPPPGLIVKAMTPQEVILPPTATPHQTEEFKTPVTVTHMDTKRLRVLLVPDSTYWVTGTIAKSIVKFNPWIEGTVASGTVLETVFSERPDLMLNFDLVHFVCPYASRKWLPAFREMVPCVTTHHHVTDWEAVKHNLEGDAIMTDSNEWKDDLRARGISEGQVICVPTGVNSERFRPAPAERRAAVRWGMGIIDGSTVIGFFAKKSSNDDDRKGTEIFSRAIIGLRREISDLTVLIVGPGWKGMVEKFRTSGIKCVWFPFIRDNNGLAKMYSALDFYWITARVEGGPVTLLEAMSSGVCCITTPVGLVREIVADKINGVVVPIDDVQGFIKQTAALALDASARGRIAQNGRQTILHSMDVSITMRQVCTLYSAAFKAFSARCGRPASQNIGLSEGGQVNVPGWRDGESIPLEGFPPSIRRRVEMLETLAWSEHLVMYQNERAEALRLIARAWRSNPLSLLPPRVLLRRFMPANLVTGVVSIKHRVQSKHSAPTT